MLYEGLDEQARHEHMLDEYKDQYVIIALLKTPPGYYRQCENTTVVPCELNQEGKLIRPNKGSPKYV